MGLKDLRVVSARGNDPDPVFDEQEIRLEDVFAKTRLGVDDVREPAGSTLPPKLRTVLMLIDGRTPFNSFKATLHTYGDVTQLFSILRDLGLIVKTSSRDYVAERPQQAATYRTERPREPEPEPRYARSYSPLDAATQAPRMAVRIANAERGYDAPAPAPAQRSYVEPASAPRAAPRPANPPEHKDVEPLKSAMIRDVSNLLGSDADLVIVKIQACRTKDDLFATMMGIKKIITVYTNKSAAEMFATKYQILSV